MMSVFDGGVGCTSGGIAERSRLSDTFLDDRPDGLREGADDLEVSGSIAVMVLLVNPSTGNL